MIITDVQYKGRDTLVTVQSDPESVAAATFGVQTATGKARCRKADHYDEEVGFHIAAARAVKKIAEKTEEAALALPITEEDFLRRQVHGLRSIIETIAAMEQGVLVGIRDAVRKVG